MKVKMGNSKCFIEVMHANEPMVVVYDIPDQAPLPLESEQQRNHVGIRFQAVNHKGAKCSMPVSTTRAVCPSSLMTAVSKAVTFSIYSSTTT